MNKATLLTLPCLLTTLLVPVLSGADDFILYAPKPAEQNQPPASPDQGVLVRSITIKPGDTLAKLSQRYIGRASWFPQVLLFNSIKNPDLIVTGDTLLVPVPPGKEVSEQKVKKHARGGKRHGHRGAVRHRGTAAPEALAPERAKPGVAQPERIKTRVVQPERSKAGKTPGNLSLRPVTTEEQASYQQAKLSYLKGDYQKALELFTGFRSKYPSSTFSADVALYQADCLLHLAGE